VRQASSDGGEGAGREYRKDDNRGGKSDWVEGLFEPPGPTLWQAIQIANEKLSGTTASRSQQGTPGKSGPAVIASLCPKPPLGSCTKAIGLGSSNALLALQKDSRVLRHRRASADCFGANPVASALGRGTRRDLCAADRTYHGWPRRPPKTGTFYFARSRNFLLCLDNVFPFSIDHPQPVRVVRSEEKLTQDHYRRGQLVAETSEHEWFWYTTLRDAKPFPTVLVRRLGHGRWKQENNGWNDLTQNLGFQTWFSPRLPPPPQNGLSTR
jgi:hypothetical protein